MNSILMETAETTAKSMDPFVVMIVGMAVVFLGLIILIGIVKLVSFFCKLVFGERKKSESPAPAVAPSRSTSSPVAASNLTEAQRGELIAAISAAIAESMGRPVSGIRIRSIRKVG
ncbi:MAG: OadG family protein [Clostridia bacterium]|nr:OadG family protein [Clostridia bacterium]